MKILDLIEAKKNYGRLSSAELAYFVDSVVSESVPDYQISALLMAIYLNGLSATEIFELTKLMKNSGLSYDWRSLLKLDKQAPFADKHSTGGVGDKVSIVLAPLLACQGIYVPMMAGRSLSFTGGTIDKLESIPGYQCLWDEKKLAQFLKDVGCFIISQSSEICPADRKLYAMRDVTGTVDKLDLIVPSIVSKKWAEGTDSILYDVKCGSGAFMPNIEVARSLAASLNEVSSKAGMRAVSFITSMNEPLGSQVGNAAEINECLWIMRNEFPNSALKAKAQDLKKLIIEMAAELVLLQNQSALSNQNYETHKETLVQKLEADIDSGLCLQKFIKMCRAQGVDNVNLEKDDLPIGKHRVEVKAKQAGTLLGVNTKEIGMTGLELAMGRRKIVDEIRHSHGFEIHASIGDRVQLGDTLMVAYVEPEWKETLAAQAEHLEKCFAFSQEKPSFETPASVPDKGWRRHPLVLEKVY